MRLQKKMLIFIRMKQSFHGYTIDFTLIPDISEDDIVFLSGIFERFTRVAKGYQQFTQIAPERRIPLAAQILETQPRTGWQLRFEELPKKFRSILSTHANEYYGKRLLISEESEPTTESVLEHCAEAQELFNRIYRNSSWAHRQWGVDCMKFHDFHEAIDGDFTPNCPITRPEKKRLEAISTKLLCESRLHGSLATQHLWNCTQLFEGHVENFESVRTAMLEEISTQRSQGRIAPHQEEAVAFFEKLYTNAHQLDTRLLQAQVSDIDALHMAVRSCRMVKEGHVKHENREKMQEFWDYIDKKIQTTEARNFFEAFKMAYLDDGLSYTMALNSATNSLYSGRQL